MVIGIFVTPGTVQKLLRQRAPFKIRTLVEMNQDVQTTLYFFSMNNIDFKANKVNGTYFDEKRQLWDQTSFPLPDVFYNRIPRGIEPAKYKKIKKLLQNRNIRRMNAKDELNKWEMFRQLQKSNEVRPYLPHTILYQSSNDLQRMVQMHNDIYLKDSFGRRGKQIMRIQRKLKTGYRCSYYRNKPVIKKARNFSALVKVVRHFFGRNRLDQIIIQQSISLLTYQRHRIDFRAEVQRNKKGKLTVTGIPVRFAKKTSPVSSSRTESTIVPFELFFKQKLKWDDAQFQALQKRVHSFLTSTYKSIEQSYGPFAELGIDFALDQAYKIWLIECNATSGKRALVKSYDNQTIQEALRNPLEYAKYNLAHRGDHDV